MYFDTFRYILVFLPVTVLLHRLTRRIGPAWLPQACLLLASLAFYGWSNPANLGYLLSSILVNWFIATRIGGTEGTARKRILQLGIVLNVAYLSTFKYLGFFLSNFPAAVRDHVPVPNLAFPLGISFFTLTQIMYLVDCYEELNRPSSLFDHATFVSFFPYVISGPLSRSRRILHQFEAPAGPQSVSSETVARAIYLFCFGLAKKAVLADSYARVTDRGFGRISELSGLEAWVSVSAYALQLYFDFSGYSDMAVASALLFGVEIPRNFDAPLRSLSIIEFWKRWHISLSAFITTYLYTPLVTSFSRVNLWTASLATLLSMAIAGLWHGPSWNFILFGVIHGLALILNQIWRKQKLPKLPPWLSWLATMVVVDVAFVFFRAPDLSSAEQLLVHLFGGGSFWGLANLIGTNGKASIAAIFTLTQVVGIAAAGFGKSSDQLAHEFRASWGSYATATACLLVALLFLNSNLSKPFVYFGF